MNYSKDTNLKYRYLINDRFAKSQHYFNLSSFFASYEQLPDPSLDGIGGVQAFTGLIDNEGTDIYEGDLVKFPNQGGVDSPRSYAPEPTAESDGVVYEIFWDRKHAGFSLRRSDGIELVLNSHWTKANAFVVGNIHGVKI